MKIEYIFLGLILAIYIVYKIKFGKMQKEKRLIKKEKREIQRESRAIARENKMLRKKADVGGIIFTLILGILYIPFSMFSTFGIMMFDDMSAENILYSDAITSIFTYMPIICLISIISALVLRIRHRSVLAAFAQLIPIIIFICSIAVIIWFN